MINKIINNKILLKSLLTMFVQALGQGCAFITAILLARYLSINDYGYYIFGITIATILAVISTTGAGGILARSWGQHQSNDLFEKNKYIFQIQNKYFNRGIIFIVLCILIFILYMFVSSKINYIEIFTIAFAIPFFIANLLQSFFVAQKKVVFANFIQLGLRIIMLCLVFLTILFKLFNVITLIKLMFIIMFVYIVILWLKQTRIYGFKTQKLQSGNFSFALMQWGLLLLSQIDILILKVFSISSDIAIYGVALQLSALVSFVLNAVNSNVLSQIASDYKNCDKQEFQKRITSYTKIIFSLSCIAIIGLIIFGYPITLLYGSKYIISYYIFCILMIGQFVNILSGCVATILNMTGNEKSTCIAFYIALIINIVLGSILTYSNGIYGLAIASSISMIYWNIHLLYKVITKININPTVIKFLL